ncbi:hypothetical protein MTO96_037070, partial [Rhipicephalus appendiculatus]
MSDFPPFRISLLRWNPKKSLAPVQAPQLIGLGLSRRGACHLAAAGGPCRLRRSRRLSARRRCSDGNLAVLDSSSRSALGTTTADRQPAVTLSQLPPELLFCIFRHCDVNSIGVLSICSKHMRDQVIGYLSWPPALEVLSFQHMNQVDTLQHCRSLGVLMKRVTCLFPIMERLEMVVPFIEKFVGRPMLSLSEPEQDLDAMCRRWRQYGAYVMNAMLGWRDNDCEVAHYVLLRLLRARLFTGRVLGTRPGELLWALPAHPHSTTWSPVLGCALAEMGAALASLHDSVVGWTSDDTIDVIEELF